MKHILILIITLHIFACKGNSNNSVEKLWQTGQQYRSENKLKESISKFQLIIEDYPLNDLSAKAQFQIADIYLNDTKEFEYSIKEFTKVIDKYPDNDLAKKSLFMIAYIYNNYLESYSEAIDKYNLFIRLQHFTEQIGNLFASNSNPFNH